MDGSQLPPAPQSIKTRSMPERSNRKQLTDNRTSKPPRCGASVWLDIPLPGYLRDSTGRSTYPSESDQIFHDPEAQPKELGLCPRNSTEYLPSGRLDLVKRHQGVTFSKS